MTILDTLVISVSALSAFFDAKLRKIPNWLTLTAALLGIAINGTYGWTNFYSSVGGLIIGIVILLLPFSLGWIGAGDVKFFGVVGALLGVSFLPRVFFYSALVAGLIAVFYLVVGSAELGIKRFWIEFKLAILSHGRVMPEPIYVRTKSAGGSVPWGVAFAFGTIIAYYGDPSGQFTGF